MICTCARKKGEKRKGWSFVFAPAEPPKSCLCFWGEEKKKKKQPPKPPCDLAHVGVAAAWPELVGWRGQARPHPHWPHAQWVVLMV